jgi:NADPH:quinone reductase-like Zn-dependent oxidoreductase
MAGSLYARRSHDSDAPDAQKRNSTKKVLITAATGGVGLWAIQLARLAGARVVGRAGPSNLSFVESLGADQVLDYSKTNRIAWNIEDGKDRRFDLVLDCVGGETLEAAWSCVAANGVIISVAMPADLREPSTSVAAAVQIVWIIVDADAGPAVEDHGAVGRGQVSGCI